MRSMASGTKALHPLDVAVGAVWTLEGLTMLGTTALLLAASLLAGGVPAEKAFREWGDFNVGVWTSTDAKGTKLEVHWEWILDKSFLRVTGKFGEESIQEIHGIDPATGQWAYWGFESKGRVYKGGAQSEKSGEWTFHSSGQGKAGLNSYKAKCVKLGADKVREGIEELMVDGKKLPPEVLIWTRKK
jgi:hypothetical protein